MRSIIIDASNVCWGAALLDSGGGSGGGINRARPPLLGLALCVNYFERHRVHHHTSQEEEELVEIVAVAPDWWQRETHMDTEDQIAFEQLVRSGRLHFAQQGEHDDLIILHRASVDPEYSFIVSNDRFRDHTANLGLSSKWYDEHRIGFKFKPQQLQQGEAAMRLEFIPDWHGNHTHNTTTTNNNNHNSMEIEALERFFEPGMWALARQVEVLPDDWEDVVEYDDAEMPPLGLLIGRQGARIRELQQRFGCEIRVVEERCDGGGGGTRVFFKAMTGENLELAKRAFFTMQLEDVPPVKSSIAPLDRATINFARTVFDSAAGRHSRRDCKTSSSAAAAAATTASTSHFDKNDD